MPVSQKQMVSGSGILTVTVVLAVAERPEALVTVTAYVPAVEAVIAAVVAPVLHA
jgi:hypothetical protein